MELLGTWRIAYVDYLAGDFQGRHSVDWCRKKLREDLPPAHRNYPLRPTDSLYEFKPDGWMYVWFQGDLVDKRAWKEENGGYVYDSPLLHEEGLDFMDLTEAKTLRFEGDYLLINNIFSQLVLEKEGH